jgi:hypothetical protein
MINFEDFLKSRKNEPEIPQEKALSESANEVTESPVDNTEELPAVNESLQVEKIQERKIIAENNSQEKQEPKKGYKIYRDKSETFLCELEITGADPNNSKARIILETNNLTYMFEGSISEDGKCKIPLKSMSFLKENESGKIKLEVIADDMIFSPWEDVFYASNSKKVAIKIIESIEETPKVGVRVTTIS